MYNGSSRHHNNLIQWAGSLFEWIWLQGQIKGMIARLRGQSRTIRYLDSAVATMAGVQVEHTGIQPIRLEQIVGTQGRMNYDCEFYPLQRRDKKRWMSVAIGMRLDGTGLAPIEVVQVGNAYYTLDGTHRVSVARALNKLFIDADVTRWYVPDTDEDA